jgi:hypothetical protein
VWDRSAGRVAETNVLGSTYAGYRFTIDNPDGPFSRLVGEIDVNSSTQFDRDTPSRRRLAENVVPHAERMFNAILAVANASGLAVEAKPPAAPEAPKPAAGRLLVRPVAGDFKQGVWLDGQSPVDFEAVLTDTQGKPMAGVSVELTVVDRDLPRRGQFAYVGGRATDAEGRMRGRYLPPRVEEQELARRGPILGFQARATPSGAAPLDANENVPAQPLVPALLRADRAGYVAVERIPVQLPSLRAGSVRGRVILKLSRAAHDSSLGPPTRTPAEYAVAGARVELVLGARRLGEAVSDANGRFALEFTVDRSAPPPPAFSLPEPVAFTAYEPALASRIAEARRALVALADAKTYGYQVAPLLAQIDERFPARFAAAPTAAAIEKELDRLHRVELLTGALWKTHDLVTRAAGEWAESLTALVESLLDIFNPLDLLRTGGTAAEVQKWAEIARDRTPLKRKIVQSALEGLASRLQRAVSSEPLRDAAEKLYEATAWDRTKDAITTHLLKEGPGEDKDARWKEPIVAALTGRYRDLAQKELDRAASLWETDKLAAGGQQGPVLVARYAEIAEHQNRVMAQQLSLDLYKADVKLGMGFVGNGIKIIATGYGAVGIAPGVELIEKGLKTVNVGLDGFQGFQWLHDYGLGMRGIEQFSRAALDLRTHCMGAGC